MVWCVCDVSLITRTCTISAGSRHNVALPCGVRTDLDKVVYSGKLLRQKTFTNWCKIRSESFLLYGLPLLFSLYLLCVVYCVPD